MRIPDFGVLRHDGVHTTLHALAEKRPVALVFLRHLGCIFCREQVGTLRDALPDENLVFVTMSPPALTERFRRFIHSPHLFICDPERRLYHEFHVERGSTKDYFSLDVVRRTLDAYRKGYRNSLTFDDQLQNGGTYVIDREGNLLASFPSEDLSDMPSPEVIRAALVPSRAVYGAISA